MKRWPKSNLGLLVRRPGLFVRAYWPGVLALLIGASLDALTTWRIARWLGPDAELHPAMWLCMKVLGPDAGLWLGTVFKVAFALLAAAIFRRWCMWLLVLCGLLYALGAISNHFHLL